MKTHSDHNKSYEGKLKIQRSCPFHNGGKHCSVQAEMVLVKELRVLNFYSQAAELKTLGTIELLGVLKHPCIGTH